MKGKMKITMSMILDVDTENYPGAKTIEDCIKMQTEYCKDGTCPVIELFDLYDNDYDFKIEEYK
jgi:hypothetical protein